MKIFTLTLLLSSFSLGLFSQEFEVPKDYSLEKREDFVAQEQNVLDCYDWLMKTPLNEQTDKRKEANAFLLKWLTGSAVSIEIKQEIVSFMTSSLSYL